MKKSIITALALAASVSVASAYNNGKYDGEFGMSLEGIYGISGEEAAPDLGGANLSLFNYIETGSTVHQISMNLGILAGSHHPSVHTLGVGPNLDSASYRTTYVPFTVGYTFNAPIGESTMFYVGAKAGFSYVDEKLTAHYSTQSISVTDDGTEFTWSAQLGFKFAVTDSTDFIIGYEYMKVNSELKPDYHMIKLGFSWNF